MVFRFWIPLFTLLFILQANLSYAWNFRARNSETTTQVENRPDPNWPKSLEAEDLLNIACLKESYPEILEVEEDGLGVWLRLVSGQRILYSSKLAGSYLDVSQSWLDSDVKTSMAEPYVLDPERP
ncbi:MAG: hypothetical protein IJU40_03415, partial [Desulfovibrionaceae bacterium]|nr:hypothetical protein [Desulfovibrionaceae bacterium]